MALKHTFQSVKSDGADATLVQPSNWNADHVVDTDGVLIVADTTTPSAPASGFVTLFGRLLAGAAMLCGIGPVGAPVVVQPFFGQRKISLWSPMPNSTSTTNALYGIAGVSALGTATARAQASTNFFTAMIRVAYVSSSTVSNRGGAYTNVGAYLRGNAAGQGGFRAVFRFGASDAATVATANSFIGFAASSTVGTGGTEPSSSVNILGIGHESTDTNLSIYTNDGSGTATRTALGSSFPANTLSTDAYELVLYCQPNTTTVGYQVTRLNTGDVASGTISSDLPVNTQLLFPFFMRGNMSTALAVGLDIMGLYVETEN